ncbi:hypothetical protein ASPCAL09386 [Aspergillus calidoustus]|uniref:DUF7580 domain-containing protein n=1 Tax=Aspergillus calidoustus TaxID=454130 RepID=A0A0U5GYV5_ASPCI|nr:hypothetical protein ASPCAL09386 [Aspergillus calidoustus]
MRLLRDHESYVHTESLHEILEALHSSSEFAPKPEVIELCRRDRLFLAATLASAVLQLHGTWLKNQWSSHDIQFANNLTDKYSAIKRPYLSWQVSGPSPVCLSCQDDPPPQKKPTSRLLPLTISLIELSLATAKILDKVQQESGSTYCDVVKECLYWSQPGGLEFGDEKSDERLFEAVVSPLLRDFSSFEGISYVE